MKLRQAVELFRNKIQATSAAPTESTSRQGRKYYVQDTKYGQVISEHDDPEEAEKASLARPYSKVVSDVRIADTPVVRDIVRRRMVKQNPEVDS